MNSRILRMIERYEEDTEEEIAYLKSEVKYWRDKYNESLMSSIRHGENMMGLLVSEILKAPGSVGGNKGES